MVLSALTSVNEEEVEEEENLPSVDYYVSPLAQIHQGRGRISFSSGCVVLPGSRITVHDATYSEKENGMREGTSTNNMENDRRKYSLDVFFAPYTLVEEYAEIDIYVNARYVLSHSSPPSSSANTTTVAGAQKQETGREEGKRVPLAVIIGSHNRFKSYSRVAVDYDIGSGNLFFPHAYVNLCRHGLTAFTCGDSNSSTEEEVDSSPIFAIGHDCRFASHVYITPVNLVAAVQRAGVKCGVAMENENHQDMDKMKNTSGQCAIEQTVSSIPTEHHHENLRGSEWIMNHLSFLMGAPNYSDGDDDEATEENHASQHTGGPEGGMLSQNEEKSKMLTQATHPQNTQEPATVKKILPTVWVVPTGGTRSLMETHTRAHALLGENAVSDLGTSSSAQKEEAARNRNEVEQMCIVYMELYGTWAFFPE